jgi:hypothetical protein
MKPTPDPHDQPTTRQSQAPFDRVGVLALVWAALFAAAAVGLAMAIG